MPRIIKFTATANKQLDKLLFYLQTEFGTSSVNKLLNSLENKLNEIATGFIIHKHFNTPKKIHYFILRKKSYILYKINSRSVTVVGVYSTKQNILKRKK